MNNVSSLSGLQFPPRDSLNFSQQVVGNLMIDYGLTKTQAVAIVANLAHESGGFTQFHEGGQPDGLGGYGWAQWTGPRRGEFLSWASAHQLEPTSDEANYGFLRQELDTTYRGVIAGLRQLDDLHQATAYFEQKFEGAGTPLMESRLRWADRIVAQSGGSPGEAHWSSALASNAVSAVKTVVVESADGLMKTVNADYDGNGVLEHTETWITRLDGSQVAQVAVRL